MCIRLQLEGEILWRPSQLARGGLRESLHSHETQARSE